MTKIAEIIPREILNAKGQPTIETAIVLDNDILATASSPSGTSVGKYEALDLKDNDKNRYDGLGVKKAIENIKKIIEPELIGMEINNQSQIDQKLLSLDGTENKSNLGGNTTLSISMACAKAAAKTQNISLFNYIATLTKHGNQNLRVPTPLFNILNGGKHAGGNTNFQEFLVIPISSKPFTDALEIGSSIYFSLKKTLEFNNFPTLLGDEGGFAPNLSSNTDGLTLIKDSVSALNLRIGFDIFLGLDAASTNFYSEQRYHLKDKKMSYSNREFVTYYQQLINDYNLLYLEDPFAEDDWDGWVELSKSSGQKTLIVGDDLIATNPIRLQQALDKKAITGIIIKPNQIGTVIEAIAVVEMAKAANLKTIVSHRSGETNDDFIADFAVGVSSDYVKFGAPARGERVAKYNRLLEINQLITNRKVA